jgi:hypothetical protein
VWIKLLTYYIPPLKSCELLRVDPGEEVRGGATLFEALGLGAPRAKPPESPEF